MHGHVRIDRENLNTEPPVLGARKNASLYTIEVLENNAVFATGQTLARVIGFRPAVGIHLIWFGLVAFLGDLDWWSKKCFNFLSVLC